MYSKCKIKDQEEKENKKSGKTFEGKTRKIEKRIKNQG
jgi:hypothetical protein